MSDKHPTSPWLSFAAAIHDGRNSHGHWLFRRADRGTRDLSDCPLTAESVAAPRGAPARSLSLEAESSLHLT